MSETYWPGQKQSNMNQSRGGSAQKRPRRSSETEGLKQAGVGRGDKRKRVGRPGRVLRRERLAVWGKVATFKKPVFSKDQSSSAATGLLSWP